jgi:hypothetical protein
MLISYCKKNWPYILLFIFVFIIALATYKPHTFITGWDTLHPEFDFGLNFKRLFAGVWREDQGLGAVAGHSHMADMPRVFIMWISHFILPTSMLRFSYLILCLFLGPLGIVYLIKTILKKENGSINIVSFLSGLFYLLNLSTVEQFYVPFEMFPTQYAYLPWIVAFSIKFLFTSNKKYLLLFSLTTLLATPQAYAAHLWYPFFAIYSLFLFLFVLLLRKPNKIRNTIFLLAATLIMNSFWLFPNLYFIATSSSIPKESKQNRIYSQEYLLRNREHGYIKDVALAKGFYFSWQVYDFKSQKSVLLMPEWIDHLNNPVVLGIGYIFFICVFIGVIIAFKKKKKEYLVFTPFFIVPCIFLLNRTVPFSTFFDFLLRFSLFEEALRFVYTKFSIMLIFGYVIFFAIFSEHLFSYFKKNTIILIATLFSISLIIFAYPVFKGNLISEKMKVTIPHEYQDFWSFMKTQPDGKILSLPLNSFSGWQYYKWGYQGSGFIWFGLKQPLLDRDSDRWSIQNEQSFREFQYSLYSKKDDYFEKNLEKYNIQYILWDKNVISAEEKNRDQILFKTQTQDLLTQLQTNGKIKLLKTFGNIDIYILVRPSSIGATKIIPTEINPIYQWNFFDSAYYQQGDYFSSLSSSSSNSMYYPFRNILSPTDRLLPDIIAIDTASAKTTFNPIPTKPYKTVFVPNYLTTENMMTTHVVIQQENSRQYTIFFVPDLPTELGFMLQTTQNLPLINNVLTFTINGKVYTAFASQLINNQPTYIGESIILTKQANTINGNTIMFQTTPILPEISTLVSDKPSNKLMYSARYLSQLAADKEGISYQNNFLTFKTTDSTEGIYLSLDDLDHNMGYIINIESANKKGLPLRICLRNSYSNICSLYDELTKSKDLTKDFFFVPPYDDGFGYALTLDNISYGNSISENQLKSISIIPFPFTFASQTYFTNILPVRSTAISNKSTSINGYTNLISLENIPSNTTVTAVLYQSYQKNWDAYLIPKNNILLRIFPFFGEKLTNHVMIDNWANGWQISSTNTDGKEVITVFWPQYLEYIGFLLAFMLIVFFIRIKYAYFTSINHLTHP